MNILLAVVTYLIAYVICYYIIRAIGKSVDPPDTPWTWSDVRICAISAIPLVCGILALLILMLAYRTKEAIKRNPQPPKWL